MTKQLSPARLKELETEALELAERMKMPNGLLNIANIDTLLKDYSMALSDLVGFMDEQHPELRIIYSAPFAAYIKAMVAFGDYLEMLLRERDIFEQYDLTVMGTVLEEVALAARKINAMMVFMVSQTGITDLM